MIVGGPVGGGEMIVKHLAPEQVRGRGGHAAA